MEFWKGILEAILTFIKSNKTNEMRLQLIRFKSGDKYTIGSLNELYPEKKFLCFTLEDGFNEEKVYGETRIPPGKYNVTLRTVGGKHTQYSQKFPTFHKGMLWLRDVPNYEYVLIHIGNYPQDTEGCILVGNTYSDGFIGSSTDAYKEIYPRIANHLFNGGTVTIEIVERFN